MIHYSISNSPNIISSSCFYLEMCENIHENPQNAIISATYD